MDVFFFGLGYSSREAARALRARFGAGLPVSGTTRDPDRAEALRLENIAVHAFDGHGPGPTLAAALDRMTHLVVSIAPGADGDPVLRHHRADLMRAPRLSWICYYSTVGVYGDHDGAWIDETAPLEPRNARSRWRVDAEAAWRDLAAAKGVPLVVLRLAGIYGPGRSSLDKLAAGIARRIVKPGQVFNRIHVADIGRVTALAVEARLAGVFNLADDEPAPPQDVVEYASGLTGLMPPPLEDFATAALTPMARSFYADNKRIANAAIKRALGIELVFPTYRHGMTAIFEGLDR